MTPESSCQTGQKVKWVYGMLGKCKVQSNHMVFIKLSDLDIMRILCDGFELTAVPNRGSNMAYISCRLIITTHLLPNDSKGFFSGYLVQHSTACWWGGWFLV